MNQRMDKTGLLLRIAVGQAELFPLAEAKASLDQSRRVDTLAPILDPTGWIHRADMERDLAELLASYMEFVAKAQAIAERHPSLPITPLGTSRGA